MKYRVETITPERAKRLLDQSNELGFINRTIRRNRVDKLVHAIQTGQWRLTHQPLAITSEGSVMDGQHRLHAIAEAGQEVEMLVVRDADPSTFTVVDTGAPRTTGDSLKMSGYTDVNVLSATVRGYLAYDQIIGTTEGFRKVTSLITTDDVIEFLDDPDQRRVAQGSAHAASGVANGLARYGLKTTIAMSMMVVALRKNEVGNTTAAEFYARLGDGVSLSADSPILSLRRWFMHDTGYAKIVGELRRPVGCANIIKAMNDYALGRPRALSVFRAGVEAFPAPLPIGTRIKLEQEIETLEEVQREQAQ